ncbi:glycoside hydrolase family 65 protein [Enterococcus gilvus]|uniref:Maltose phosphorylase n=1 Tax=Enterococcus gilvus ATCC BAA-350 TaxID=1158614 RepID=R2XY21_9ENTE|nr:glycoside hydrolase family 65 protein [Enterococcus gilvus]EOI54922.1 maltose phosphorylase [Enterococcus gilvus ATCC BAA-350]EOW81702.1 maltose phosphorylase [Enterococcus gilvus ATCC BAA-350]MBS5821365.1 glycoside hydrolase family 65 protein [Enterococcus gilvus]OJG41777.1 maltose phosphorylase [Enterococcus gilvus]
MEKVQRIFEIDPWKIRTTQLDKENRRLQESLTSIGNGYMGMRGNFEESYSGDHHQGTYLAGIWYPDKTRVGWWKNGYPEYFGKVINAMDFIQMKLFVNDHEIDLATTAFEDFDLELDMENGLLTRSFVAIAGGATVRFTFERFLSIVKQELAVIRLTAECLAGDAQIRVLSKLDNNVQNEDSNYEEMFWLEKERGHQMECSFLTTQTIPNDFGIEQFSVTGAMKHVSSAVGVQQDDALEVAETFTYDLKPDESMQLEKRVVILTSRDVPESEQSEKALALLEAYDASYEELLAEQNAAWAKRWALADVSIGGDDEAQQGIRFNIFQLFSTYYGEDDRLNIGPKGFTGEKYGGATYWDTEAYAVPMYLGISDPTITKNLLKYRHNQLPQAKHNARQQGLKGALYPMVTFTGVECHNEWEITFEEIHRNGAIAHAIYNYTTYTGDESYIQKEGLEVLTEISRFWADRVHYSKRQQKYMIHGVTGPNEYENNINNNWYTNYLATWVLSYTLENYQKYQAHATVTITQEEQTKWQDIVQNMYFPKDDELGIFVQHDTFLDKDLLPTSALDPAERPLNQHWSWDKILRSCFIKQADVLQGIYFFGDSFTDEEKRRNFEFYEPMTVHESSLSASVHAILAAELGLIDKSMEMYQRTARLDLDNYNNDTDDGLHITSMTGSWLAIVQGFAQMKTSTGTLSFAPLLPKDWDHYSFHITYRGRLLAVTVTQKEVRIDLKDGSAFAMMLYGQEITLKDSVSVPLEQEEPNV